jgi:voltage-gated potassium channel
MQYLQYVRAVRKARRLTRPERQRLMVRLERVTELPLLVLSFLMVPLLAGPYLWELTPAEKSLLAGLNVVIWASFAADLAVKTLIAPDRMRYLRQHWIDVIIVAVPFFRPFRLLRLVIYGSRAFQGARRLSKIVYAFGSLIVATSVIVAFERETNSQLSDFPEALWWGIVTITTVGYGDITPVTVGGRIVAGILMLTGIGMFSFLTANFASKFVGDDEKLESSAESKILAELELLRKEVRGLRVELERATPEQKDKMPV